MMAPTKLFTLVCWDWSFLPVAWPIGVQRVFFFCSKFSEAAYCICESSFLIHLGRHLDLFFVLDDLLTKCTLTYCIVLEVYLSPHFIGLHRIEPDLTASYHRAANTVQHRNSLYRIAPYDTVSIAPSLPHHFASTAQTVPFLTAPYLSFRFGS